MGVFAVLCVLSFRIPPCSVPSGYYYSVKQKHELLDNTPSPKVVFLGGSNLAFGLDSPMLEKKLGMPVVNMGMCNLFGLRHTFGEVVDSIRPGDLLVLVPEYYMLEFGADGTTELMRDIEAYPPSAIWIFKSFSQSPDTLARLAMLFRTYFAGKWRSIVDSCLNAAKGDLSFRALRMPCEPEWCFDKQGDYLGHLQSPVKSHLVYPMSTGQANQESIALINRFSDQVEARGAKLVMLPSPIPQNSYEGSSVNIARLYAQLHDLCRVVIPVKQQRYVFSTEDFYETPYHLNARGRALRTQLTAEDLRDFMPSVKVAGQGDVRRCF